jgi:hypothetical protein
MNHPIRRRGGPLLLCLLLAGGAIGSFAARAQAGPVAPRTSPAVRQAEVEISEATGSASLTTRFVLGLTDNELSQLRAQAGDVHYVLKLRRDTRAAGQSLLSCEAERIERGRRAARDVHVRAAAVVEIGRRVTLASVARPDGSRFELAVTLR